MTASPDTVRAAAASLAGALPPMDQGEPVFAEPWQGRAFGLALATVDQLGVPWDAFRDQLIAAIGEAPGRPYYESWVVALERLVGMHGLTSGDELAVHRASAASYRHTEHDDLVETVPLTLERAVRVTDLRGRVLSHVELYRRWRDGTVQAAGVRAYDRDGQIVVDQQVDPREWERVRDRALSAADTPRDRPPPLRRG
jgi:nitrile hydratase accessory protein